MNCLFLCVFHQEKYVEMLYLLLESIFIYGNLSNETDILIYTSTRFMQKIKQSHLYCDKIKFEINDTYDTVSKACKARLDLFQLPAVHNYEHILYLDTDIIIKNDVNKVFEICKEELLYVLEEGLLTWHDDFYGGQSLFGAEIHNYADKTAFTSGILLFKQCEKIKFLFEKIAEDIVNRPCNLGCQDQPYVVYNAFKYNLYNNKALKLYAANNDYTTQNEKVIHHFPGGPGIYEHKIVNMKNFLNYLKEDTISNNIIKAKEYVTQTLFPIIKNGGELLEGNIFTLHHSTHFTDVYALKVKNISNLVLNKNIKKVLEIGFNAGFSTLLMLISNPELNLTCMDLGEHTYTMPCYNQLKETFGDRLNIILGDSTKTLSTLKESYDLIHIDGGHSLEVASSDIIESYRLAREGTILIMDDYDFPVLRSLWDNYVYIYKLAELDINVYPSPHHSIKCRKNATHHSNNPLKNKSYTWETSSITFLEEFNMSAFGHGTYFYIDAYRVNAFFGGRCHLIQFSNDYSEFRSIRRDDLQVVGGKIIENDKLNFII